MIARFYVMASVPAVAHQATIAGEGKMGSLASSLFMMPSYNLSPLS